MVALYQTRVLHLPVWNPVFPFKLGHIFTSNVFCNHTFWQIWLIFVFSYEQQLFWVGCTVVRFPAPWPTVTWVPNPSHVVTVSLSYFMGQGLPQLIRLLHLHFKSKPLTRIGTDNLRVICAINQFTTAQEFKSWLENKSSNLVSHLTESPQVLVTHLWFWFWF